MHRCLGVCSRTTSCSCAGREHSGRVIATRSRRAPPLSAMTSSQRVPRLCRYQCFSGRGRCRSRQRGRHRDALRPNRSRNCCSCTTSYSVACCAASPGVVRRPNGERSSARYLTSRPPAPATGRGTVYLQTSHAVGVGIVNLTGPSVRDDHRMSLRGETRVDSTRSPYKRHGTVTLIEKWSGTNSSGHSATGRRRAVHFQAAALVAVTSCQTAKRSAISVRHSSAVNRCRPGWKCGEMPEKADRNRCACPTEVNRFIARSRCLVG